MEQVSLNILHTELFVMCAYLYSIYDCIRIEYTVAVLFVYCSCFGHLL